jgi:hypothetical protein
MSTLLFLLIAAAAVWAVAGLLRRGPAADPSESVRGFSEALHALERAPRRLPPGGGRRA